MTRRIKNGVKRGGVAIPLESNIFMLNGKSHKQGGIDIDRTVEAQGGEIMRRFGKDKMQILSKEDSFPHGNPVKNYLNGMSFNDAFTLQQLDNAMLGRGDFGKAKYGIETEFDRIKRTMAIDGTNRQGTIRPAREKSYYVGNTIKKKLGDKAGNLVNVINYLYGLPDKAINYVAKNVANTAPKSVKNASDRMAKRYKTNTTITPTADPMSSSVRGIQSLVNSIPDESYRNIANIPLMLYPGKGMRQARKGAAGTGGARKTGTPVQGTLNFAEPTKPKTTRTPRPAIKSKTGRTLLGEILGMTDKAVMERMKQSMSKEPVKFTPDDNSVSVEAAKRYNRQEKARETREANARQAAEEAEWKHTLAQERAEKARITREKNKAAEQQRKGVVNTFLSGLTSDLYKNAAKNQIAKAEPINFTPEGSLSAEDYAYYKGLSDKLRKPYRIEARQKRDFERQEALKQRVAEEELPLKQRTERKSKARALEDEAQRQADKGATWFNTYNRPKKVTKRTIIEPRSYNTKINLKTVKDPVTGKSYNAEDVLAINNEENPFAYRVNVNGKRYGLLNATEYLNEGSTSRHRPYVIYKGMKSRADKLGRKKVNKPTTTETPRTETPRTETPRNNNKSFAEKHPYIAKAGNVASFPVRYAWNHKKGIGATIGLGAAAKYALNEYNNQDYYNERDNAGEELWEDKYGRKTKNYGGRSITLRGVGNNRVRALNGVFVNGYLPSTENAITRATNNNYNKVKSRLRNYTSVFTSNPINLKSIRRTKAPWGTDGRWYSSIAEKMLADRNNNNTEDDTPRGAAGRKRAGLTTPDVNVDHTGGTGITNPNNLPTPPNITLQTTTPNVDLSGINKIYNESLKNVATNSTFKSRPTFSSYWKGFNGDDLLSAGINTIGTVGSFLVNNHYLNKMQEPPVPITVSAPKLRTRYNINPQLTENREAFSRTMNSIRSNMASSSGLRNSLGGYLNSLSLANNKLEADKENRQIALINEDNKLRGEYNARNASTYNDYLNRRNEFINNRYDKKSENWVNMFNNFNAIAQHAIDNKQKRRQMRLDYLSTLAPYINIITGNDTVKANELYNKIMNGIKLS